jgi:hypothetical protein
MTEVNQASTRVAPGRPPKRRRSELERLLDRTVLGPSHPELGTCWLFTGTHAEYGLRTRYGQIVLSARPCAVRREPTRWPERPADLSGV